MTATIDATVRGANANSFGTLDEANAYFAKRLNAEAWEGSDVTNDLRIRALIQGTERLEQEDYIGRRETDEQRLQWPRVISHNRGWIGYPGYGGYSRGYGYGYQSGFGTGFYYTFGSRDTGDARYRVEIETGVIPEILKTAQFELAYAFLEACEDPFADTGLEPFLEVKVGNIMVKPRNERWQAGRLPRVVMRLLAPVLMTQSSRNIRISR